MAPERCPASQGLSILIWEAGDAIHLILFVMESMFEITRAMWKIDYTEKKADNAEQQGMDFENTGCWGHEMKWRAVSASAQRLWGRVTSARLPRPGEGQGPALPRGGLRDGRG